ncbi:Phage repressor protein C, contains Cro/C1-type HTH and peptisase s24 domains [Sphingomonas palmae]|uniref:Phage repressor protein C, contains Cro/C1-type HTH and peptisase s24 domains n=2 Tax=Sphingomonas palmae TaxID=1855283 RepID=A0A1H7LBB7_9SPHN|nr:Phage repressor protein C, contains Cro/C1-type HTH and peptisase s24 domains [Sphingomonas palmae]
MSALSRMLGRNIAYLQQYVRRGTPRVLPERDRRVLAAFFDVEEALLGGPVPDAPVLVRVPYLGLAASAGPGADAGEERVVRYEAFAPETLRAAGIAAADASIIDVRGESMAPHIRDGDRVLVDRAARTVSRAGDLFVIRVDDLLAIKRVRRDGGVLVIASDNPLFATIERAVGEVVVIGRARLLLRNL